MQNAILKLREMGQMPSDREDVADETLEVYGRLLREIRTPVCMEEARCLAAIFPQTVPFGLEWTLLHTVETVLKSEDFWENAYRALVERCLQRGVARDLGGVVRPGR